MWQALRAKVGKKRPLPPPPPKATIDGTQICKAAIGKWGEDYAAYVLESKGFHIAERNFRDNGHEIDLIATKGNLVVFCEVKTRTLTPEMLQKYGRPALAVGQKQRKHIRMAAAGYMAFYARGKKARFDVMEIYITPDQPEMSVWKVCHLEDAFRT